jgi:hypothetical protein
MHEKMAGWISSHGVESVLIMELQSTWEADSKQNLGGGMIMSCIVHER